MVRDRGSEHIAVLGLIVHRSANCRRTLDGSTGEATLDDAVCYHQSDENGRPIPGNQMFQIFSLVDSHIYYAHFLDKIRL